MTQRAYKSIFIKTEINKAQTTRTNRQSITYTLTPSSKARIERLAQVERVLQGEQYEHLWLQRTMFQTRPPLDQVDTFSGNTMHFWFVH